MDTNSSIRVNGKTYNINVVRRNNMYSATIQELSGHSVSASDLETLWSMVINIIEVYGK